MWPNAPARVMHGGIFNYFSKKSLLVPSGNLLHSGGNDPFIDNFPAINLHRFPRPIEHGGFFIVFGMSIAR